MNVVFLHGIGNHSKDYASACIDELKGELPAADARRMRFSSVLWGDVLDGRQNLYMNRAIAGGDMDWLDLRREYVLGGLGDACAYLGDSSSRRRVWGRLSSVFSALVDGPTVVVCHSMGCAVMMDYLHAAQLSSGLSPALRKLQCAILFGCNLPLFWLGQPAGHLRLPKIPRVYNLYDSDDLLGYPLKNISDQTQDWVTADYRISTGTVLGAHTGYWTDADFVSWVAKCLSRELRIAYPS